LPSACSSPAGPPRAGTRCSQSASAQALTLMRAQVLDALWTGRGAPGVARGERAAAAAAFADVLCWAVAQAPAVRAAAHPRRR